jgi:NADPH:quinone reductase-like Zn-dependent oxidoreductase
MQAVQFAEHGDVDVIEYGDSPAPDPADDELLVDMVVDHGGAATRRQSLASLAKGGRLVTCGATTGPSPETDINRIFWNQLAVIGSTMGSPGEVDDGLDLVWDGHLEPRIRDRLPMSETARDHEMLQDREGFGTVVVPDSEL